jgi:adenine-specific DNA-methyltransferase
MISKTKEKGVVYTPQYIVKIILDQANYKGEKILRKHVIDNSCGDGAFLVEITNRYIEAYFESQGNNLFSINDLISELQTYIHGIEIDEIEVLKCKQNLDDVAAKYEIKNVLWDVNQGDTLKTYKYNGKMDYVLGNPPYVRVHNLKENFDYVKQGKFTRGGMTDLFIIFYEIGLEMLNDRGILAYITPSSIFNSLAGSEFRNYVIENTLLTSVIDLKHFQAFDNFMTYTAILTLDKNNNRELVEYYHFDEQNKEKIFIDILMYENFCMNNNWYFGKRKQLKELKEIINTDIKNKNIEVKNGFATLADKIFIKPDFGFDSKYIYPIIKGSTKKWYKVIYPYDEKGNVVDFDFFEKPLQDYLFEKENDLKKRSIEKNSKWYAFGRSQGVKDFWKEKISINSLIRDKQDIKLIRLKAGQGIYSGLYIVGNISLAEIEKILLNDEFVNYISMLGKYKSGGYYTYSTSDLKKYICYKLTTDKNNF